RLLIGAGLDQDEVTRFGRVDGRLDRVVVVGDPERRERGLAAVAPAVVAGRGFGRGAGVVGVVVAAGAGQQADRQQGAERASGGACHSWVPPVGIVRCTVIRSPRPYPPCPW